MNNASTASKEAASERLAHTHDDGGDAKVSKEFLQTLKGEMEEIAKRATVDINHRRQMAEDVRYCRWAGQSADGLKHERAMDKRPHPFEGSSDARVRTADMVVMEQVMLQVTAAMRSNLTVKSFKLTESGAGSRLQTLLRWILKNDIGPAYRRNLVRLSNWALSDAPAAAVLGVFWEQARGIRWQEISLEEIPQILQSVYGMPPEEVADVIVDMQNPTLEEQWVAWLNDLVPGISAKRCRQVIRELREDGKSRFPMAYTLPGGGKLTALRLFDDIFIPSGTEDLQSAPVIFQREWLPRHELEARKTSFGYSDKFVKELVEKGDGKSGFPEYELPDHTPGDASVDLQQRQNQYFNRGRYEVVTAYFKAVNEDGALGTYVLPFSSMVEVAATDRKLLDYPFAGYPFVWFGREHLTSDLWDSRSLPELLMTEQSMQKFLIDATRNHTHLSTVPPIKTRKRRPRSQIVIKPLGVIEEDRPGEVEFMDPPKYPLAAEKMLDKLEARVAEYTGRRHKDVPADLSRMHAQWVVDTFLTDLAEALRMLLQLYQTYLTEEQLEQITGDNGQRLFASREELEGAFNIEISFAAGSTEMDWIVQMAEIISKYILPIDTLSTVQRDKLVAILFSAIDPNLAEATLQPAQSAQLQEVQDEDLNLVKMMAGVEPPMLPSGQNFQVRLQALQANLEKNPEIAQKLTPLSQEMVKRRMEHLSNQVQQEKNKQIGRAVGNPVFGHQ